jgi:hypothetical protein
MREVWAELGGGLPKREADLEMPEKDFERIPDPIHREQIPTYGSCWRGVSAECRGFGITEDFALSLRRPQEVTCSD